MTATIAAVLLLGVARVGYGTGFSVAALAAMGMTAVFGTLTCACLGYALAGLVGSPEAARPIVQATMLPLYFISGVWIPTASLSPTLHHIADLFAIEHLAAAFHLAIVRASFTTTLAPQDLLVLALWAMATAALAVRRFTWLRVAASAWRSL